MGNSYCLWKGQGCELFGAVGEGGWNNAKSFQEGKESYSNSSEQQDKKKDMLKSPCTANVAGHILLRLPRTVVW